MGIPKSTITSVVFIVLACAAALPAQQQKPATDSDEQRMAVAAAMKEHSYTFTLANEKLEGPGADFLKQAAATAQFIGFGEEHNVKQFPEFVTALFEMLHPTGFNYLAIENDPVSAHVASIAPLRGDELALRTYSKRYPNAITFATDQEVTMMAAIVHMSTAAADPIWGLDQSFGVLHALDRLAQVSDFHPGPNFNRLLEQARAGDRARLQDGATHFMENVPVSELEAVRNEAHPAGGSEAQFILDNLISSAEIYGYYRRASTEPVGYFNGYDREQQMKRLFMRLYRDAQSHGDRNPRVIAKLGHWHIFRGIGPSHLQTFGNFLTEFATANGFDALTIGVYLRGSWRDVSHQQGLAPIALATDPNAWTIVDFRPLRPLIVSGRFGKLDPNLVNHIFGFDVGLIIGAALPGTTTLLENSRNAAE